MVLEGFRGGAHRSSLDYHSSGAFHLFFLNRVSHWPGAHRLDYAVGPVSPKDPPKCWKYNHVPHLGFLMWVCGLNSSLHACMASALSAELSL